MARDPDDSTLGSCGCVRHPDRDLLRLAGEATFRIDGRGKIRVSGAVFGQADNVYPVTGGTGDFAGVGGESHRFFLPHGRVLFVLRLIH